MKLYILVTNNHEFDCGDSYSEVISVHETLEGAKKAFDKKEAELLSDEWGFKIIRGKNPFLKSYQNYCCNLTMTIFTKTLKK